MYFVCGKRNAGDSAWLEDPPDPPGASATREIFVSRGIIEEHALMMERRGLVEQVAEGAAMETSKFGLRSSRRLGRRKSGLLRSI